MPVLTRQKANADEVSLILSDLRLFKNYRKESKNTFSLNWFNPQE